VSLSHWALALFFRLLYGPFAWAYDAVAWLVSFGEWRTWGEQALPFAQAGAVLELGHGPGHLQVAMARRGWPCVGVDPSPQMGRLARHRLKRAGLPLRLVRARGQALPFRKGVFSTVLAAFPTEFILDPQTVREVGRVLRPQGRVVIVAAAHLTGRDLPSRFLEWLYRVTGQREPLPRQDDPLWRAGGLRWETRWVPTRRAQVMILVGQAPP